MTELGRLLKRGYTIKEAAAYLGCGIHGVRDLIWQKKLRAMTYNGGRKLYIDLRDLDRLMEDSRKG